MKISNEPDLKKKTLQTMANRQQVIPGSAKDQHQGQRECWWLRGRSSGLTLQSAWQLKKW
jgi:hypothetical protein